MFYFVVVWKAPRPPRDSTWFTLGVSKCPVLHISRRVIWKCVETLPSILHFSSLINLGLSILPLDKVLVFCETKILNWGGNFFLSWEITQDAIKMCFADGNICKPCSVKSTWFSLSDEVGRKPNVPVSLHAGDFSVFALHSLHVLHFPLGL